MINLIITINKCASMTRHYEKESEAEFQFLTNLIEALEVEHEGSRYVGTVELLHLLEGIYKIHGPVDYDTINLLMKANRLDISISLLAGENRTITEAVAVEMAHGLWQLKRREKREVITR